mmetsp:Transcript_42580/g.129201  ORF Transcript_42580/g.129201 Transcript_42580/m.129201 type:complete len:298 (-) Transcript_42580:330-1223(-)
MTMDEVSQVVPPSVDGPYQLGGRHHFRHHLRGGDVAQCPWDDLALVLLSAILRLGDAWARGARAGQGQHQTDALVPHPSGEVTPELGHAGIIRDASRSIIVRRIRLVPAFSSSSSSEPRQDRRERAERQRVLPHLEGLVRGGRTTQRGVPQIEREVSRDYRQGGELLSSIGAESSRQMGEWAEDIETSQGREGGRAGQQSHEVLDGHRLMAASYLPFTVAVVAAFFRVRGSAPGQQLRREERPDERKEHRDEIVVLRDEGGAQDQPQEREVPQRKCGSPLDRLRRGSGRRRGRVRAG